MLFTLKPTLRYLALALPALLSASPAALGADQDKFGPVLPPPSLYDDAPASRQPGSAVPPTLPTPAPAAVAPAPPPPAARAPEPVKTAPSVTPQPAVAERSEPWYRRWFSWLPWNRPAKTAASKTPSQPPVTATVPESAPNSSTASMTRSAYAFDGASRLVRSGGTGECVKMGLWTPEVATVTCHPSLVASRPPLPTKAVPPASLVQAPITAPPAPTAAPPAALGPAPAAAPLQVALVQPPKAPPAGSAPAPMPVREYAPRVEPVEVLPLPPRPPAATEERPLAAEHVQNAEEEPLTALAVEAPPIAEPEYDKLSLSASGLFALSSTKIRPSGQQTLDEMVEHLRGMRYDSVLIVGHTDPTGPKVMNDKLSRQRAESVKQYLVSKGVDPGRIKTEGKGSAEPLAKTQNCDSLPRVEKIACYAPDRRVEIEVVGGSPHT